MCYDVCSGSHPHFGGTQWKMGGKFKTIKTPFLLKAFARKKMFSKKKLPLQTNYLLTITEAYLVPRQISVVVQLLTAFAKNSTINV